MSKETREVAIILGLNGESSNSIFVSEAEDTSPV